MTALDPGVEFDYSPRVRELFVDLRHAGMMAGPATFTATAGSREQGAQVSLQAEIDKECVQGVCYQAYGCPHFLAACESLARWLEGRALSEGGNWSRSKLEIDLGLPAQKRAKLLILEDALLQLLAQGGAAAG